MIAAFLGLSLLRAASPDLASLKPRLDAICRAMHGRMGYSLKLLADGRSIDFRGDERFPTASTIKTAVAVEVVNEVEEGKLKWSDKRAVPPMEGRQASMWAYFLKDGTVLDVDAWTNLMITVSDNTATMVLRDWLGMDAVNTRMEKLGLKNTKVLGSFPPDRPDMVTLRKTFGLGVTTPNEMARLLELIYRRKAASPAACEKLMRILSHQYWDDLIGSSVPVDVRVSSKSGAINRSRSDTAIVFSPECPYVLTVYTDDQKDQRWVTGNEGEVAIFKVAQIVWNALNPKRPYVLPAGYEKFAPTGGVE